MREEEGVVVRRAAVESVSTGRGRDEDFAAGSADEGAVRIR